MSRPKKKEISLNKESVLSLMQEIYNELVEQRATAIRIQNKMLSLMKDSGKIEHILELEYGRKLDSILNKTWEIDYVSFDDLFFGAEYHKTNKKIVDC